MYKRGTVEYDTKCMQKYNEDLNATLIFVRFCNGLIAPHVLTTLQAGLFSAVSSAFVIDVQPKLEPDSGEMSEASTDTSLRTKILPLLQRGAVPLRKSSQPRTSCMQAC